MTYYFSNHFIFKVYNENFYDVDNLKKFDGKINDSTLYFGQRLQLENVFYSLDGLL